MQPVLVAGDVAVIMAHGGLPGIEDLYLVSGLLLHTLVGLAVGYALLDVTSDSLVKRLLGAAILVTAYRRWRRPPPAAQPSSCGKEEGAEQPWWWPSLQTVALGMCCGVVSVLTNNSGLLLDAYLLGLRLPKARFLSVRSSYLLAAGVVKLVGHLAFGVLPLASLPFAGWLCLAAVIGMLIGKQLVKIIPQAAFDLVVAAFVVLGALRLLILG
mmetsp:Transcript_62298/g.124835  ORF Transcript_62298/g.124835 Transcript_62298/m.124835 type:complete len:213 (+) Transcript_62298:193-831(+)